MSNPLRLFRKYQAAFLVAFGIVLMFAFVVGPILSDYLDNRMSQGMGSNPVVVSWKGGELREVGMDSAHTVHLLTTRFLRELTSRVSVRENDVEVERKGQRIKLIKGRTYPVVSRGLDEAGQMSFQIVVDGEGVMVPREKNGVTQVQLIQSKVQLIAEATGEEELVQRMLLAKEAEKLGVVIGGDAVIDYLDNLCDITEGTRPDYAAMLSDSTNGRLDMRRFIEQMSMELAAQRMLIMSRAGLFAFPPEVLYQCYNKLNRRIIAELLAVDVRDFLSEVGAPTEQDITALYEEGKNRFPMPTSPDPGFKQRRKIAFQYVVGTFDEFQQREMEQISPTITDEEIEEYYEEHPDRYKILELPETESTDDPEADATPEGVEAEMTAEPKEDLTAVDAKPAKADPGKTEPAKTEPAKTKPAKTEPAKTEPAKTEPAKTEPAKAEPAKTEPGKEDTTNEQASVRREMVTFVSYQEPEGQAEPAKKAARSGDPTPPASEAAAKEEPKREGSKEQPAEDSAGNAPKTDMTNQGTPPAGDQDPKAESAGPDVKEPAETTDQIKPLNDELREEIRATIARDRARGPAQEKLKKTVEQVRVQVDKYARNLSRFAALAQGDAPTPLDLEAIAKENNLIFGETPQWDELDISRIRQDDPSDSDPPAYELARTTETVWGRSGQFRRSLIDVGFSGDLEKYVSRRLVDGITMPGAFPIPPQKLYLFWRVEEVPEKVPELAEIRDDVAKAWKMRQALPLAQAKAEEMARQAGKADKPLAEVFSDSAAKVIRTVQFSWMTRGSMPGGTGGRPMLSPINGMTGDQGDQPVNVSGVGNDFMRSVFALDVGEVGTATNDPQAFVYVVRVNSEDLSDEQRREAFYATGLTPEIDSLVRDLQMEIVFDWFEGLKKDYNVKWARDADNTWNRQQ